MARDESPHLFSQFKVQHSTKQRTSPQPLTRDEAHDHMKRALSNSKWDVVRGWHVLRHSFISMCVANGVDQRILDKWVGHTTSVRERYQHLTPNLEQDAIKQLFS